MQVLREQRLENRFRRSFPLQIQFEDSNSFAGEVINLSTRGLSCLVPCYVPPFSRLTIHLDMPFQMREASTLSLDALVVRTEKKRNNNRQGEHILGLFFLHLDQDKASLVNQFLTDMESVDRPAMTLPEGNNAPSEQGSCVSSDFNPQHFLQDYKLTRLDRLACLGELSSVLAHEIKNPLACLAGSLQILGDEIRDIYPSDELFSELFGQIERIDNIVDHLLQFSVTDAPQLKMVHIDDVINSTLGLLGGKLKEKNIRVDLCHGVDQPRVSADERLLRQAFLNIFSNLVDGMERDGCFSVNTYWEGKTAVCDRTACECFAREEDQGISVVVMSSRSAKGNGKSRNLLPLSLAERKKRGLNLSLTQQIIEQHNGRVYIQNQPEQSSVLLVTLPI